MLKKPSRNAKGGGSVELKNLQLQVDALTTVIGVFGKQVRDITAREAALRWFVEHQQPLTKEVYDSIYAKCLQQYDDAFRQIVQDASEIHRSAMLQRLLESHEGKPQ